VARLVYGSYRLVMEETRHSEQRESREPSEAEGLEGLGV
jgi:hypothetical protein